MGNTATCISHHPVPVWDTGAVLLLCLLCVNIVMFMASLGSYFILNNVDKKANPIHALSAPGV